MEKCYIFKGQSLENGLSSIFQALGNILLMIHPEQRQQNAKFKVKGKDPVWSQICPSV